MTHSLHFLNEIFRDGRCWKGERMEYLVTAEQMKTYDRNTIQETGIPSLVLMERAAYATAMEIMKRFPQSGSALVVCGCGNNGGDGFAVARILKEHGFAAECVLVGDRAKCSVETEAQIRILERQGNVPVHFLTLETEGGFCPERDEEGNMSFSGYDIIVDALFGIGLSRNLAGICLDTVEAINRSDAFTVAVDIPSGIHADTGKVMGCAVRADLTVTYGYCKLGMMLYPGTEYTGELLVKKIGIWNGEQPDEQTVFHYTKEDLDRLPQRRNDGNKGTFGKVLVIAGSHNMCGACQFATLGAYRVGAGLVRVLTAEENRTAMFQAVPEAVLRTYGDSFPEAELAESLEWADCVLAGSGIGTSEMAKQIMEYLCHHCTKPLVIDADGINILSLPGYRPLLKEVGERTSVVITPHIGEFSRLMDESVLHCKEERFALSAQCARDNKVCVVCKDARTVVADMYGHCYLNVSGDSGMATGGTGDVLAGIVAGLMAQGMDAFEAACLGTYLHGLAGNLASDAKTTYSVLARDLLDKLPEVLKEAVLRKHHTI